MCIVCGTTETPYWHSGPKCKRCYSQDPKTKAATAKYQLKATSRFAKAKRNAVQRHKEWNLTFEEYCSLLEKPCYYCAGELGTTICYGSGLDRLDNTKGYLIDNVVSCCKYCNSLRNNFITVEEAKFLVQTLLDYRKRNLKEVPL
jgi:hypothetical protein